MNIRLALSKDTGAIMNLMAEARAHLKSLGVDQWQKEYPARSHIEGDIAAQNGYVLTDGAAVIGYACISFDGEESYNTLKGQWLSIQPYAVVHRMAVACGYKGQGLASRILLYAEELCQQRGVHSIKVDTDADNAAMQHILQKNGYTFCGDIRFDNSDKIAYEKLV